MAISILFHVYNRYDCKLFRRRYETSNGRLPLKQSSHTRETWPKCVSDDSQRFIFRRRKKFFSDFFSKFLTSNQQRAVLEELRIFERYQHVELEKWPQMNLNSALYDFCWRGLKADIIFFRWFLAKTDFHFSCLLGTQGLFCWEHKELLCLEHKEFVVFGTQGICFAWNKKRKKSTSPNFPMVSPMSWDLLIIIYREGEL